MPELPEVETVRKGLEKQIKGFYIQKLEVLKERSISNNVLLRDFTENLQGSYIGDWTRRGKYLIGSLNSKNLKKKGWWGVHLRMTGQFKLFKESTLPCPHTRVRLWNEEGIELRFVDIRNFGQMWWVPQNKPLEKVITGLRTLGPEPFSEEFNISYFQRTLKGKTRSIKSALLDQSTVAGVGNIYADESLFDAGILPTRQCKSLKKKEIEHLRESLIKILKISIGVGGTTFSDFRDLKGVDGKYGGQALVYKRGGLPCRKCGKLITRKKLLGRGTHWCSNCQI